MPGFAVLLAESLWLSGEVQRTVAAMPLRRSLKQEAVPAGKPEAFRKESGKAGARRS